MNLTKAIKDLQYLTLKQEYDKYSDLLEFYSKLFSISVVKLNNLVEGK